MKCGECKVFCYDLEDNGICKHPIIKEISSHIVYCTGKDDECWIDSAIRERDRLNEKEAEHEPDYIQQ